MAAAGADEEGDSLDSDSDDLLIDGDNDDEASTHTIYVGCHDYEYCFLQYCTVQSGAAYRALGFEDGNLKSSLGWWADTVATYCPSRLGELPKFLSTKPCAR